jgi:hypothetical protein
MQARSFCGHSVPDVCSALDAISDASFKPTLALLFASKVALDLAEVAAAFAARGIDVFGVSSASEIMTDGTGEDCVFDESCVGLLLDVDRSRYAIGLIDGSAASAFELGEKVGVWAAGTFAKPSMLIGSAGMTVDGEQLTRGILSQFSQPIPLFGGLAGDDCQFKETLVFSATQSTSHGVVCLSFDAEHIQVAGIAASGWQAVGAPKKITKSAGNVVFEIDGVPVIEAYERYLGGMKTAASALAASTFALQLIRPEGYSVLRAGLVIDHDKGAIVYGGSVPEGSTVRFSSPPGTTIIKEAQQVMSAYRERQHAADALVLFSCKGRHLALGPAIEDEIEHMQKLWNAPLAGYCSYGEIGYNEEGFCDFYNDTCVLVTLTEKMA